jgi:hypothetical protein
MEKIELDSQPPEISVLSVSKNSYRSGTRYDINVKFCWGFQVVGDKVRCYTETILMYWDRAMETSGQLIARANAILDSLKLKDTTEANLIFLILNFEQGS